MSEKFSQMPADGDPVEIETVAGENLLLADAMCGCIAVIVGLPDGTSAAVNLGKDAARAFLSTLVSQMGERNWLGDA